MHISVINNSSLVATLEISPSHRVLHIKQSIKELKRIELGQQTLVFSGGVLEDMNFISEYGITEGSVINLTTPLPHSAYTPDRGCPINVIVKKSDGRQSSVSIHNIDTVRVLYVRI